MLRRKDDFSRLYNKGKSVGEKYVVIFCRKNGLPYTRTAYLASKKVGNSVCRNRARRLMKESMRLSELALADGYDYVFIARAAIVHAKCNQVRSSMERALRKIGAVK